MSKTYTVSDSGELQGRKVKRRGIREGGLEGEGVAGRRLPRGAEGVSLEAIWGENIPGKGGASRAKSLEL